MYVRYNYLQDCLALLPKITYALFGQEYDMDRIVTKLKNVGRKDTLSQDDLMLLRDATEWDYKKFWPDPSAMVSLRKPIEGCFKLGWEGRETAVRRLYERFQHIEVVSIVLRFVDPKNYGIISPPVEKFLALQPQDNHVKYYLTYLDVLKEISCHYNRPKVLADVDMALWCLSHLLKNWGNRRFRSYWDDKDRDKVSGILVMYNMDTFLKRQRLRRVLYEVYEHVKESKSEPYRLLLAEGLNDERIDPELAVVTASYTFESLVWKLVQEARLEKALGKKKLWNMIRNLIEAGKIRNTEKDFDQCKKWRDSAVHPWLRRLKAEERKEYIEKVKTLVKLKDKER